MTNIQKNFDNYKWARIIPHEIPVSNIKEEIVPEYVECIGLKQDKVSGWAYQFTIRKIYKNNGLSDQGNYKIIGNDNTQWYCDISQFKPSTFGEFSAQENLKQWKELTTANFTNSYSLTPKECISSSSDIPEKWYVKATIENRDVLRKWRNGGYSSWSDDLVMLSDKMWSSLGNFSNSYKEITFEQFKQHILKEPIITYKFFESSYVAGIDPYMNETIEVGSIVRFKSKDSNNAKFFKKGLENLIVYRINNVKDDNDYKYMVKECDNSDTWGVEEHEIELMTKKASQIQQNNGKKVDEQLPNIAQNYEILDIFKPKSSKTMDFTSFQQQSPKELGKISKNKHLTI